MAGSLLIDGNSIGFASHQGTKLSAGEIETQAIFGVLRTTRSLITERHGFRPFMLWDGKTWRKQVFEDYKANREPDEKTKEMRAAYKAQRPRIARALKALGITQMFAQNMEADDLAGIVCDRLVQTGERVILVSGDKDWLQLVQPGVMWFDPIRVREVNYRSFETNTDYKTPAAFLQGKALQGDTSDNIPGVGGVGEKGAKKLLEEWGSVEAFFEAFDKGEAGKLGKRLTEFANNANGGRDRFALNMRLMDLRTSERPKPENLKVQKSKIDREAFEELCAECAFNSILKDLDSWIKPFELLHERNAKRKAA